MPPETVSPIDPDGRFVAAVAERGRRRNLRADLDHMRYANAHVYGSGSCAAPERTLYVGVGHGHDAVLALLDGLTGSIVGVDPYIAADGNDDVDFRALIDLRRDLGLEERLKVERTTIEDYLTAKPGQFDLIVCNDVLHHIFETGERLSASPLSDTAAALFRCFAAAGRPGSRLVVSEVQRHGLRPLLGRLGVAGGAVEYRTKQTWRQWSRITERAGWQRTGLVNYVPYALRRSTPIWRGGMGRLTLCDRYFLHFRLGNVVV